MHLSIDTLSLNRDVLEKPPLHLNNSGVKKRKRIEIEDLSPSQRKKPNAPKPPLVPNSKRRKIEYLTESQRKKLNAELKASFQSVTGQVYAAKAKLEESAAALLKRQKEFIGKSTTVEFFEKNPEMKAFCLKLRRLERNEAEKNKFIEANKNKYLEFMRFQKALQEKRQELLETAQGFIQQKLKLKIETSQKRFAKKWLAQKKELLAKYGVN